MIEIKKLTNELCKEASQLESRCLSTAWSGSQLSALINDENYIYVTASEGQDLVGVGGAICSSIDSAEIFTVAVSKENRGKGIGKEIVSKLIDASYPNYQALIPKDHDISATLDREEFIRTTKLAALFARSVDGSIICETKSPDILSVRSIANEFGENDSTIKTKVDKDGVVRLNSRFLITALNAFDTPDIVMEFSTGVKPILLKSAKDDKYIHIIMPLNK
jgi:DNA polymerase III sliding clamp (beta) subunit (PCNA family)